MEKTGYVANKPFKFKGVEYKPGEKIDMRDMEDHKVSQFLGQRLIRPDLSGQVENSTK